ncbi:alpha/beta fold hydrolase [Hyphomicrobium sulfonivorans]|uniref:alpha/beta fold hydrolase n=1 Tax=Hyphomicrobium sulfonivorans TaxID=121290 RepID=UPI001FEC1C57|nr:alpha/beta hydrolase [Hyphomicrobium sulfonivorans]
MQILQDKRVAAPRCPMPRREMHLDQLPPQRAGDLAFRIFCTPELSQHRSADHDLLTARARFHLRHARWQIVPTPVGDVQTYVYEPDGAARGTMMLVHGWTSEAAFMTAFIEPLRRSGYRVVAFDFPAHGMSPSRRTNLADCARAMLSVCDFYGPIEGVVAHSFGGFVSLLVAEGGAPLTHRHPIDRFVLIGCPNTLSEVTTNFGQSLRLGEAAQRAYEQHLERVGHRPVTEFSSVALLRGIETDASPLIIHGRKDDEVGFHNAEEIAAAIPSARLLPFDELGHRNVLFAPPVFRAVMSELGPRASDAMSRSMPASSSCGQEMKASA